VRRLVLSALTLVAAVATLPSPAWAATPVELVIPSIGVDAPIEPLGADASGAMMAPSDPDSVGWFAPGPGIDEPGNVLLDGHVDWAKQLRVFAQLHTLHPGDKIVVNADDGSSVTYTVAWSRLVPLDGWSADVIEQPPDAEWLTLITCGGVFDPAHHVYLSRRVVRAERTDG
jgi:LPXTG-site transpeptidase (sortase) family protein